MILFTISQLQKGTIIKRPSAHIKTPYVADVTIENIEFLAHTPSLGCCGLADKGADVLMEKTEKTKTNFRVILGPFNDINSLKNSYNKAAILDFENLEIIRHD